MLNINTNFTVYLTEFFIVLLMGFSGNEVIADSLVRQRQLMIETVQDMALMTEEYTGKSAFSEPVIEALNTVPRHEFVLREQYGLAYINSALPIEHQQTISQPFIVALMTDLAAVDKSSRVLEVGTGSGYQAAILAELVQEVYSIEIIEDLSKKAEQTLVNLGYQNIYLSIGDGYLGWSEYAPYDAILVTAAAESLPQPLVDQLAPNGRLVIPLGKAGETQMLTLVTKNAAGEISRKNILPVAFVPLTGEH